MREGRFGVRRRRTCVDIRTRNRKDTPCVHVQMNLFSSNALFLRLQTRHQSAAISAKEPWLFKSRALWQTINCNVIRPCIMCHVLGFGAPYAHHAHARTHARTQHAHAHTHHMYAHTHTHTHAHARTHAHTTYDGATRACRACTVLIKCMTRGRSIFIECETRGGGGGGGFWSCDILNTPNFMMAQMKM